jgi:3'-phosphoadenosine 5'-phosphosulfate sulfotransferase (PAPS reductase)/FAD synthetase
MGDSGLGEESDFLSDGGSHLLAPSRRAVEKNLAGIKTTFVQTGYQFPVSYALIDDQGGSMAFHIHRVAFGAACKHTQFHNLHP